LKVRPAARAEPFFIKGRISHVVSDEFIFGSAVLSVTVDFDPVSFEYEELPKDAHKPASQRASMCEFKSQLSAAQDPSFRDELITPETTVILSEMTV
jgi:hypothetical protein